ncbi:MAG: penicillin-binding transpeptidase domain-containing protein [Pyrinomonadaceae bacterium]
MKLMFPKKSFVGVSLAVLALVLAFSGAGVAQSKKTTAAKKAVAKKAEKPSKDANKGKVKAKTSAKSTKDTKKEKASATKKGKSDPKAKIADAKAKKGSKYRESKKEAAERKRKEAERQAAIAAERRRREQAAREARARALAFERGLRTETVANIAKDNTEGEDLNIRAAAVSALGEHAGSVVVMEAQTGKVLTIVNQDWAVRSGIKPCSTIKLVTGVAALNENVIDKQDGSLKTSASNLALDDALAFSNNAYFQRAGSVVGSPKTIEYAKQLGLGEPTGLNTEGEFAGKLPYGNNNARIYSHGDDYEVTGLQLAVMVSAISNGGNRVVPHVPRNDVEKADFHTSYRAKVELPRDSIRRVIPGMMGAAEYGTARRGMDQTLGVAGKTGSCISKGSWVGLFASVAPIEQPKYSVVVITRGQKERGRLAAAVAAQIYQALAPRIIRTDRNLAQTEFHLQPRSGVATATTAKVTTDDEDDDAATGDIAGIDESGREIIVVPSAPRTEVVAPTTKKLVTKTGSAKPLFPPVVITPGTVAKPKKPELK